MKLVEKTLGGIVAKRPRPTRAKPQGLCLDKGYDFDEVRAIVREFGFTAHTLTDRLRLSCRSPESARQSGYAAKSVKTRSTLAFSV
jgi:hypothetical protein